MVEGKSLIFYSLCRKRYYKVLLHEEVMKVYGDRKVGEG